ncbi:hypothetical protein K4K48_003762 [Colletotrichum sp. SAR 10_66]|nr:hypothetical protein K4K52_010820 [Colletotrichum sp. SAR 10_76]KAJ5008331.1 hypothetical protein K4K48_003762 [Colletotrichum sp. SAR 10_66]
MLKNCMQAFLLTLWASHTCAKALEAPIPGYGVFVPRWEITGPDGKNLVLRGTVEEVAGQLRSMNPDWDHKAAARNLHDRAVFDDKSNTLCHNFREGNRSAATLDIDYLRSVPGKPLNGAGPANCGRVNSPKELTSFADIADGASRVLSVCTDKLDANQGEAMTVSGQAFHPENWNVVIRGGDDCSNSGQNISARGLKLSRFFKFL